MAQQPDLIAAEDGKQINEYNSDRAASDGPVDQEQARPQTDDYDVDTVERVYRYDSSMRSVSHDVANKEHRKLDLRIIPGNY
jgi:hypothetical protein